jgi:undecaprenyl-diphosphatase
MMKKVDYCHGVTNGYMISHLLHIILKNTPCEVLRMPDTILKFDVNILFYIQEHSKSPLLDRAMVFFTRLGDAGLIWVIAALVLIYFKQYRKCGIYLVCVLLFASLLGDEVLKYVFHRVRPCNLYPQVPLLIRRPLSYSFPSGHTSAAFALATSMSIAYPKWYIIGPAFLWATAIGYSRMDLGVHYPSDVLIGALVGAGSAWLSYEINKKLIFSHSRKLKYLAPTGLVNQFEKRILWNRFTYV